MSTVIHLPRKRLITVALSAVLASGSIFSLLHYADISRLGAFLPSVGFALFLTAFLLSAAGSFVPWGNERTYRLVSGALWGAGFAILGALYAEPAMHQYLAAHLGTLPVNFDTMIQAPIVEEITKGLGVLLILAAARGRGDAFLIALTIGLGFGTVENIQYFTQALTVDGWSRDFFVLLISRGLMGPFLHAVCVGIFGLTLTWAKVRRVPMLARIPLAVLALGAGMIVHSWGNGAFGLVNLYIVESGSTVLVGILLIAAYRRLTKAPAVRFFTKQN